MKIAEILGNLPRVENMVSPNGNQVPNQMEISVRGEYRLFQSYGKNIVLITKGIVYLDEYYWDYSSTTGKYRNMFLSETLVDTRKRIKTGEYILTNLN